MDKSRILASTAAHAGDWLHAPSTTSIGLRILNETIPIVVGLRHRSNLCEPHQCICGAIVDARGLHGVYQGLHRSSARKLNVSTL